jgi:hypothetical protein
MIEQGQPEFGKPEFMVSVFVRRRRRHFEHLLRAIAVSPGLDLRLF